MYCSQSARDDELITLKERELEELPKRLSEYERHDRRAAGHATVRTSSYSVERTSVDTRECAPTRSRTRERTSTDTPRSVATDTLRSVPVDVHHAMPGDTPSHKSVSGVGESSAVAASRLSPPSSVHSRRGKAPPLIPSVVRLILRTGSRHWSVHPFGIRGVMKRPYCN